MLISNTQHKTIYCLHIYICVSRSISNVAKPHLKQPRYKTRPANCRLHLWHAYKLHMHSLNPGICTSRRATEYKQNRSAAAVQKQLYIAVLYNANPFYGQTLSQTAHGPQER